MKRNKLLFLGVCATDKCNRGCKHCMVSATNNGTQFAKKLWIRKLVKEAKALGYKVRGTITGLGEPLMHPDVVKLTKAFYGMKVCRGVEFLTSGFLAKDVDERKRFQELVNIQHKRQIGFELSFNLYSKDYAERFEQAITTLFSQKGNSYFEINIVCDQKNYFKTFHELYEILSCIGVKLGMDINPLAYDRDDSYYKYALPIFLEQEYSEKNEVQLFGQSLFLPCIYKALSKKLGNKFFRMNVSMTVPLGFAKNLPSNVFEKGKAFRCQSILMAREKFNRILISPDGKVFASCDCLLGNLPLGTWETPLSKLLLRRKLLQKHLLRHVLSETFIEWKKWPCEECAALAKRQFSFD